jgi:heparan-alpha-glucosaminide N-acetyltransferase
VALHGATDFAGGVRLPPSVMGPTASVMRIDRSRKPNPCYVILHDVLPYLLEWVVVAALVLIYVVLVYLLPVPGCERGYQGPGGKHGDYGMYMHGTCSGATWAEHCCTGGAIGYVDWLIFGGHTGAEDTGGATLLSPTGSLYGSGPLSRFSLLGTVPAILVAYLGLQAGKVLLHFKDDGVGQVIVRWLVWAGLCGGAAVALHLTRAMPIAPALGNISFALASTAVWQLLHVCVYTVTEVLQCGATGFGFLRYMGANSLCLFITWTLLPELALFGDASSSTPTVLVLRQLGNVAGFGLLAASWWLHRWFPRV